MEAQASRNDKAHKETIAAKDGEISKKVADAQGLQTQLNTAQKEVSQLQQELETARNTATADVNKLNAEISRKEKSHEQAIAAKDQENSKQAADAQGLQTKLNSAGNEVSRLQQELGTARTSAKIEIDRLNAEMSRVKESPEEATEQNRVHSFEQAAEAQTLQTQLNTAQSEVGRVNEELQEANGEINRLKKIASQTEELHKQAAEKKDEEISAQAAVAQGLQKKLETERELKEKAESGEKLANAEKTKEIRSKNDFEARLAAAELALGIANSTIADLEKKKQEWKPSSAPQHLRLKGNNSRLQNSPQRFGRTMKSFSKLNASLVRLKKSREPQRNEK